jgi:zinc D-Ala-D-Ala carboxypeptidase
MQLTAHFSLEELTKSQTGERLGLANEPNPGQLKALKALCENVLEPIRLHYNRPVVISSGFRGTALNKATGGAETSQHCKGEAADIEVPGVSNTDLARHIALKLPHDQVIREFPKAGVPDSGWVHVSYCAGRPNRNQELTAKKVGEKTVYTEGIHE